MADSFTDKLHAGPARSKAGGSDRVHVAPRVPAVGCYSRGDYQPVTGPTS